VLVVSVRLVVLVRRGHGLLALGHRLLTRC
jgi:hypothetical protein